MSFGIGFTAKNTQKIQQSVECAEVQTQSTAKKSVVQVYFEKRGMNLPYYNDKFDLHEGDIVYVDGKLEGLRGIVTYVSYNFKIKLSDYKRVISVADTNTKGRFYMGPSVFMTFDRNALPKNKVASWFKAPEPATPDEQIICGSDGTSFALEKLEKSGMDCAAANRGIDYYAEHKVKYICLDGTRGYALIEGSKMYDVEFEYARGQISGLVCSCYCSANCKHEYAAMLALREILKEIEKTHSKQYELSGYFAAVDKMTFFMYSIDFGKPNCITLD